MSVHEGFQGLGNPEVSHGVVISGVNVDFRGFKAGVLSLDLETGTLDSLKRFLEIDRDHHPKNVTVIFDGKKPILALVAGERERWSLDGPLGLSGSRDQYFGNSPYLHLIRTDSANNNIFVEGSTDFHPFEDRGGRGLDLETYLPENGHPGNVTIYKDGGNIAIQVKEVGRS